MTSMPTPESLAGFSATSLSVKLPFETDSDHAYLLLLAFSNRRVISLTFSLMRNFTVQLVRLRYLPLHPTSLSKLVQDMISDRKS